MAKRDRLGERPIAWLMTVVAAAGMTAYADGLEKRSQPAASVNAAAARAGTPAAPDDRVPTPSDPGD